MKARKLFLVFLAMIFLAVTLTACITAAAPQAAYDSPSIHSIDCEHRVICYNTGQMGGMSCVFIGPGGRLHECW